MKRKRTSTKKTNLLKKTKTNPETQSIESPLEVIQIESFDKKESVSEEIAEERPWENLELILSLQSNKLGVKEKVDLAFSIVKARKVEIDEYEEFQAVKISRLIISLSDWIQSLLVSTEKNNLDFEPRLDFRCWEIFKFCLKQSSNSDISLNLSRNLLKAISFITEKLLSLSSEVISCTGQGLEVYKSMVDCVGLLFSSKTGLPNDNLDLWFSTVEPVLRLARRGLDNSFVIQFSCLVLDPFAKFLRTHPTKKNGFRDFLDKLFEPLLDVLGLLNRCDDKSCCLLKLIQEILTQALFHSAHIDGFLTLGGTESYVPESKESKTILQSYHRHFFTKLENMLLMKKELELSCLGVLFRLFINRVMTTAKFNDSIAEEKPLQLQETSRSLTLETRKSLFDFFLHLMEPILLEIDGYIKSGSMVHLLADLCCVLKSANSVLFSFARESIYVKTEDASGGACFCFFKKIFMTIVSVALQLQSCCTSDEGSEIHVLLAKELVTAIGYLIQIEYEVIENDLVSLWLIILSFLGFSSLSPENAEDNCPLTSSLLRLGCQLINLYSDLRQVSVAIFALCKAVRHMILDDCDNGEMTYTKSTIFPLEKCRKSVEKLFSSQELRLAVHTAIKMIPEGQAGGCIKSLTTDISETLDWIRDSFSTSIGQVAAVLAAALSDIYSLIFDSLTITTGNSNLVGQSLNSLVELIRPFLSHLVSSDTDSVENFFSAVTGKCLETDRKSMRLFIVFFLRIYMSSRSLYRQVLSLMPPKKSKEMADVMGDSVAARCGNDWIKEKNWDNESYGYFLWICKSSVSIVDIIKQVSVFKDESEDCCLLEYILYGVVIQRLVDLNKHIKSLDYVLQISKRKIHGKYVSVLKREGEELTDFLLGDNVAPEFSDFGISETIDCTDQLILKVSGIKKKYLATLRFEILTQHIDVWCCHAGKKKLKIFLSQLISSSVPRTLSPGMSIQKKKGLEEFSLGLLCDSVLYEHEFVRRYLAPSFSDVLGTTVRGFFKDFTEDVNFDSPSDWSEVLSLLETSNVNLSENVQPEEAHVSQFDNFKFTACQNLLNLLCQMPKEYMNKKSFVRSASYVLDLERVILFSMLRCSNKLCSGDLQNLFSLFVTCRKTLKSITVTSCEKVLGATRLPLSDSSLLTSWLFKSALAAITCQERFKNDFTKKSRDAVFSLMDHTSYMFLTASKYQFIKVLPLSDEQLISPELSSNSGRAEGSEEVILNFESLIQQAETLLNALRDAFRDEETVCKCDILILNKVASILSCFSGLLWGLASAVSQRDMQKNHQNTKLRWKSERFSKLSCIIQVLSNFFEVFAQCLFLGDDEQQEIETNINWTRLLDGSKGSDRHVVETNNAKKKLIESFLEGDSPEKVLVLRHLLIASAAILRLNLQIDGITFSSTFVSCLTSVSDDLLSVFAYISETPTEFSFIWLDGAVKFLEELGSQFCSSNPTLNRDLYSKLIELHLNVIGKCISLQGKEATLESHETGFGSKVINSKGVMSEEDRSQRLHWLDEFKGRLRMSFKMFIHNSSELHLLSGIQAVERSLVGVWEICPAIYSIQTGNRNGGSISETAAAGIDCLDLILEHATGRKRLNVVKRHIQCLMSAVFGIVAHIESPFMFLTKTYNNQSFDIPDAGSVILMCVEVLIRVAGKHALFQMDPWHISQSIHMPGTLFLDYLQITRTRLSDQQQGNSKEFQIDQTFSMNLYAASCRLLYTAIKHHKSETEGCIATLQESVSALLYCLETSGIKLSNCVSWEVEEGIKCACFLRRIYEELRQQKEVFGQHCFKFLSTYIWVSSGYGPLKTGIKREVDEALRPGVYALIDTCSPHDLQHLHTVFGEGPCRNSLATLQQDYKMNFKYEGKV